MEFEMAYQVRVAVDRIRFAIKHADQFGNPDAAPRQIGAERLLEKGEQVYEPENSICSFLRTT
jgi:hypothetical protein